MMHAVGRCDLVKRLSVIGSRRTVILYLVVLDCRRPIAVLTRRSHVLWYVYPSKDVRVIVEWSRSIC